MSKKYISQIINQNFVYPNNEVYEYDIELVQNINDNSVTGEVIFFEIQPSSSSNLRVTMTYTWNLNGAEKFVRADNRMSIISVHAMSPTQEYYKPFRTIYEISVTDLSLTTLSQQIGFDILPSDLGLSAFTEGTYNFEVRFIGHTSIYPVCLAVPVTFTPVPTPTPTPTPGPDCYEYLVSNLGGSTRTVTYTPCTGTTTTVNVPAGGDVNLGCVREGTIFGNVTIIQGELCGGTGPTPTPTATPVGPTPTPTPTPTSTSVPYSCYETIVLQTFSSGNVYYTPCGGSPSSTYLGSGVTNYNLGCVQSGSYSGQASFSEGTYCGGTGPTPTPTATPTATPTPAPGECYSYTYGPAAAGCTIYWTNCDGSPGSTFVSSGGYHSITCARVGSLSGCGPFVAGTLCGTF